MKNLKIHLVLLASATVCGCRTTPAAPAPEPVSLDRLLDEMADPGNLARLPEHGYRCLQASSYDRASVAPDKPGWFANADWSQFIRTETRQGRTEHVMMEDDGPGAVVRFWNTWFGPMDGRLNHSTNGVFRVYLDGGEEPAITATQAELLLGRRLAGAPFTETAPETAPEHNRAHNLHLPIPYARHCKITYETKGSLSTQWNRGEALYYQVNYRKYAPGTPVRTFRMADLAASAGRLADTGRAIASVPALPDGAKTATLRGEALAPGGQVRMEWAGPGALHRLEFRPEGGMDAPALAAALRGMELRLDFDGIPCARVPVGDFFGCGGRIVPFRTRFLEAGADWTLACHWTMPYRQKAVLTLVNRGDKPISFTCRAASAGDAWDERSMHFHAVCAPRNGIRAGAAERGAQDLLFAALQGRGRLVGDTLAVVNRADKPGIKWWGEGDEKIYVDGEKFPSHFGTGTEDYYGYAHCRPEAFASPFHAQPYGNGNLEPGAAEETKSSVNTRLRLLDDIPFGRSLRFDMELWHWQACSMDFTPTAFFYLHPSGPGPAPEKP